MDNNNEVEIYTLQDEDGNEHEFELVGTTEKNGIKYYAMIPAEDKDAAEGDEVEYVILKAVMEDGEETLVTIDDDDEFDDIAERKADLLEMHEPRLLSA